jgi:hypothetical protein
MADSKHAIASDSNVAAASDSTALAGPTADMRMPLAMSIALEKRGPKSSKSQKAKRDLELNVNVEGVVDKANKRHRGGGRAADGIPHEILILAKKLGRDGRCCNLCKSPDSSFDPALGEPHLIVWFYSPYIVRIEATESWEYTPQGMQCHVCTAFI